MSNKKIFVLIPDGIGLRNFAYSSFVEKGKVMGWEIIFWHSTPFDLSTLGLREINLTGKVRPKTDLYKRAKIKAELDYFTRKFKDPVYQSYKFTSRDKGLKQKLKNFIVQVLTSLHKDEKGIKKLRTRMHLSEKYSSYYNDCLEVLMREKPALILCSNQRAVNAIAPLLAAKDLFIKTACFIFSWDNLPKATMIVETNFYFVWSEYMKKELQEYYPYINPSQIKITGSPQFEHHFDEELEVGREDFFLQNGLDPGKKYVCFSGDDITTSPHDHIYLQDLAEAVQKLNAGGIRMGIIFRRCPVDFSSRYDIVLKLYPEVITPIEPMWKNKGKEWNCILPTKEDLRLQTNIIKHTLMVINVGSSMVFDYVCDDKPTAYINYNPNVEPLLKDINSIYNYVHFRSMPSKKAVIWINDKKDIPSVIEQAYYNNDKETIEVAKEWFNIIHNNPAPNVIDNMWKEIDKIQ